ncbi:MAG: ankyrin repeat domain-containing protein [Pseudomonadota bacterium]
MAELRTPLEIAVQSGDLPGVQRQFQRGATPNDRNHLGIPVLFDALRRNELTLLTLFDRAGVCWQQPYNTGGYTPLVYACLYCELEVVRYLCEQGQSIDQCTAHGVRGIHVAVQRPTLEVAQFLHEAGANLFAETGQGESALLISLRCKANLAAFHWLLQRYGSAGRDLSPLVLPCLAHLLEQQRPDAVQAAAALLPLVAQVPGETALGDYLRQPGNYASTALRPLSIALDSRLSRQLFALLRAEALSRQTQGAPVITRWHSPGHL